MNTQFEGSGLDIISKTLTGQLVTALRKVERSDCRKHAHDKHHIRTFVEWCLTSFVHFRLWRRLCLMLQLFLRACFLWAKWHCTVCNSIQWNHTLRTINVILCYVRNCSPDCTLFVSHQTDKGKNMKKWQQILVCSIQKMHQVPLFSYLEI